jgi:hypothetical protein
LLRVTEPGRDHAAVVRDRSRRPPLVPSAEERYAQHECTDEDHDDLRTARGIAAGVVIGLFLWLASILAGVILWQASR